MNMNLVKSFVVVFLLTVLSDNIFPQQKDYKKITLEDIWVKRVFVPQTIDDIYALDDGKHYCTLNEDKIIMHYYENDDEQVIFSLDDLKGNDKDRIKYIDEYSISHAQDKILIATNTEQIYRHSSISEFYIWNIESKKLVSLSDSGKQRLATFSPDGSKIAFVRDNNLFVKDIAGGKEIQITQDGLHNSIIYGTTDWVYEEEFGFTKAFFWSPDGTSIAFYRFDESKEKEYSIMMWDGIYPSEYKYKYPKAGEDNSVVDIYIYNLLSQKLKKLDITHETDYYIPRIKWTKNPDILAVLKLSRLQNNLEIILTDIKANENIIIYKEENKCYIDINDNLYFFNGKRRFIITSEQDGYNHIYMYDFDGKQVGQLTSGKWDVLEIKGVDEEKQLIYYTSAELSPVDISLYSVKFDGSAKTKISAESGTNDVQFNTNCEYFINEFSDVNTPPYITVNNADGKLIRVLEDNSELAQTVKDYNFSKKELFSFKTKDNIELNAWMIKPADFDENKKYPVLMYVYGGPGYQTVTDSWGGYDKAWFQLLAQKGYIIVSVDNRGTDNKGQEFAKCTYMQLGKLETIDQIQSAEYLSKLKYVDSTRIGIFGWSYGGYMSLMCMSESDGLFKAGIAVAPVTDWRFYDNVYAERYMRRPEDNPDGYKKSSLIEHVKDIKGKLLLVHGTADDNVHLQNTMQLIDALVDNNKQFEMQLYPNRNHSIYGGNTRLHLYNKMTDFILEKL